MTPGRSFAKSRVDAQRRGAGCGPSEAVREFEVARELEGHALSWPPAVRVSKPAQEDAPESLKNPRNPRETRTNFRTPSTTSKDTKERYLELAKVPDKKVAPTWRSQRRTPAPATAGTLAVPEPRASKAESL